eukprot:CAMPEP_0114583332 /NCGR_PEP_ID=MMETSP0125-20121206/7087_1 /TAXON_ID=485358 ORGANISM="Aristerostoma sp., Strain ATCC 50986" /NCGR_SAMPLE_ID=MMETSP0125 /ASSEMBLY_ACC=CAM_ASM_000245 /LENGTH=148 /DNA_ID=CAMNT_0001776727 /DNA_START=775 /DNA_END=1221 /DNA_ORIENTATION=-
MSAGDAFGEVRATEYQVTDGVLLCFDVSRKSTFNCIENWLKEIYVNGAKSYRMLLVGTKADLEPREVTVEEAETFAKKIGLEYIETSVKAHLRVDEVFSKMASLLIPGEVKAAALAAVEEEKKQKAGIFGRMKNFFGGANRNNYEEVK